MNSNVKLSWAGFSARSSQTLREIWKDKDFTDVTLVTEDGTHILAHQVILSAGSDLLKRSCFMLLKSTLQTNKNQGQERPPLFLSGLKGSLVTSLVEFIYLGECSVLEEDLDQFFKTGADFGVQGIGEVTLEDGYDAIGSESKLSFNWLNAFCSLSPHCHSLSLWSKSVNGDAMCA